MTCALDPSIASTGRVLREVKSQRSWSSRITGAIVLMTLTVARIGTEDYHDVAVLRKLKGRPGGGSSGDEHVIPCPIEYPGEEPAHLPGPADDARLHPVLLSSLPLFILTLIPSPSPVFPQPFMITSQGWSL